MASLELRPLDEPLSVTCFSLLERDSCYQLGWHRVVPYSPEIVEKSLIVQGHDVPICSGAAIGDVLVGGM